MIRKSSRCSRSRYLLSLALLLFLVPLSIGSQTVDELLKQIGPGVMSHKYQFCCDIASVTDGTPLAPGAVSFQIRVVPHWECTSFQVDVVEVDNLSYLGATSWTFKASPGDTVYFPISVEIPANDTSGMKFEVGGCECKHYARAYFAATDEIVDFYPGDPRGSTKVKRRAWRDAYQGAIERARDSIAQLPPPPPTPPAKSHSGRGFYDKDGNFYPGDSVPPDFEPWVPEIDKQGGTLSTRGADDSRVARALNPSRGMTEAERQEYERLEKEKKTEALYAEMREKEKQPCTVGSERYGVGGEVWTRSKGESKFRKLEPFTDVNTLIEELKRQREAAGIKPETHVTLDLRRADDLEFVRSLVDSLIAQEEAGIYETVVTKAELNRIIKRGILWNYYPMKPSKHPGIPDTLPRRRSAPKESGGSSSRTSDTIFFDGGEQNWPSQWTVVTDSNLVNGRDYWGRVDYIDGWVYNGDSSIWCAENGDMPLGWWYDNEMDAWMIMTGPLDISNRDTVNGKYAYMHSMEDYEDWLFDGFSFDGVVWYYDTAYTGTSSGWDSLLFEINSDSSTYYQKFWFHSGSSGNESWAGAYLDDFIITGSAPKHPDLECCTPSGWSGPIVLSSEPWPSQNDSLTAEEITYVNIAIKNTGDTLASAFNVDVLVDGEWCLTKYVDNLAPGQCTTWADEQIIVNNTGWNTISVEIDPSNWIVESDEGNNYCQRQGYFYSPPRFPNLEPAYVPGWYGPIVPSMDTGGHFVGTLYSGDTTYIDWAVRNTGDTVSGPFWTRLKYDGQVIQNIQIPSLQPNGTHQEDDFPFFIPLADSGGHTLEINIDYNNQVNESFENDNFYSEPFDWESATIGAQIKVEFQQLKNAYGGIWHSADSVRVELRDADPGDTGQVLATGWTSTSGTAYLGPVLNIEEDQTSQDIFVRVYSENPHAVVGDSIYASGPYLRAAPFYFDSDTLINPTNGWHCWGWLCGGFNLDPDTSGGKYFYVAHVIQHGLRRWNNLTSGVHDPGVTHVLVKDNVGPSGTAYASAQDIMLIESDPNILPGPDCFDHDPIQHEFGHRLSFRVGFLDDIPPNPGSYTPTSIVTPGLAANEGFAEFWSCYVAEDSVHDISYNTFSDTVFKNFESGLYGRRGASGNFTRGSFNALGSQCLGSVGGIFWDIHDTASDNFSGRVDWGDTLLPHNPDGVWDSLSDGPSNIIEVLTNRTINGHRPENIREFFQAWMKAPNLGNCTKLVNIYYEHGDSLPPIPKSACGGFCGDADGSGSEIIDISDLVYLGFAEQSLTSLSVYR